MPRFYFHLRNDLYVEDLEGAELPDIEVARARAMKYAVEMSAASILERGRINLNHRIDVADESGRVVLAVEFGDVVTVEAEPRPPTR
jgi:hypothetical protein